MEITNVTRERSDFGFNDSNTPPRAIGVLVTITEFKISTWAYGLLDVSSGDTVYEVRSHVTRNGDTYGPLTPRKYFKTQAAAIDWAAKVAKMIKTKNAKKYC